MRPPDPHASPPSPLSRRAAARIVGMLIVALAASPLLLDAGRLLWARWQALLGPVPVVQTPAIDWLAGALDDVRDAAVRAAKRPYRRLPWQFEWVTGAMLAALAVGTLLLGYRARD